MTLFVPILLLLLLLISSPSCSAHESCCKHKLALQNNQVIPRLIDDASDLAPSQWDGESRYIDDPNDFRPDDWDDDDDGEWAPARILNPKYAWKPRQIVNPAYVPPPTYWDKLTVEIQASLPWVTLGVLITGGLSMIVLPIDSLESWLQTSDSDSSVLSRFRGLLVAALLGLATPLCSCGALPLCGGLLKKGIPLATTLAFLTASQSAGLDSSAITYGLLGFQAMLGRLLGATLLALAVGFCCPTDERKQKRPSETFDAKLTSRGKNSAATIVDMLSGCLETATEIYPTIFLGLVLSTAALHFLPALISHVKPAGQESGDYDIWMRSILLGSAVPLQLCEHTSVTLASAIQKAGGSPGLAFAFLLSAPATNLPTILWIWSLGHRGSVGWILISLVSTALFLSYLVDGFRADLLAGESTGEKTNLPDWLVDSSPYLCGSMLVAGWYKKFSRSRSAGEKDACTTCCDESSEQVKATVEQRCSTELQVNEGKKQI